MDLVCTLNSWRCCQEWILRKIKYCFSILAVIKPNWLHYEPERPSQTLNRQQFLILLMDLSWASLSRSWLADSFLVMKIINKLTESKNMQRREFLVKASSGQSLICFAGVRSELWMFLWSITSSSSPVWPAAGGDIGGAYELRRHLRCELRTPRDTITLAIYDPASSYLEPAAS